MIWKVFYTIEKTESGCKSCEGRVAIIDAKSKERALKILREEFISNLPKNKKLCESSIEVTQCDPSIPILYDGQI